VRRCTIDLWSI